MKSSFCTVSCRLGTIMCVWYVFFFPKKVQASFQIKSLKIIHFFYIIKNFSCWTQDVCYFTVQSICALKLNQDWLPSLLQCHKSRVLQWAQRNFPLWADKCENSLLLSNSAYISFCTVKLKHPTVGTIRKTYVWVVEDFNLNILISLSVFAIHWLIV